MKIFDTRLIQEIDAYTIKHEPVASIDLMERAANACTDWIEHNTGSDSKFLIFAGPGNNGGDGRAIARLLTDHGFSDVTLYQLSLNSSLSPDAQINHDRLLKQGKVKVFDINSDTELPDIDTSGIIIDALFGTGLNRPLSGMPARVVQHINAAGCHIISVDIPSGLMGEDNAGNISDNIIQASDTLTFQFPKRSFLFAENEKFVGRWHILDIGLHQAAIITTPTQYHYLDEHIIAGKIKSRSTFSHKGTFGQALLISGSYGMMGAAILASKACLKSGAGLLTVHIPRLGYPIVQGAVPESVFSIDKSDHYFSGIASIQAYEAVGIGPGIGTGKETVAALETVFRNVVKPMVVDADALNIIAYKKEMLDILPKGTIITPHPREFDRMFGTSSSGYERNMMQIEMAHKLQVIIILKGAFTSVALPDGSCFYNSTGNPGMATAGSGDILTGIILSLLSQGYDPADAAKLGPYIHGLAGDLAAVDSGYNALIASDIINYLGKAFLKIERYGS